MSQIIRGSDVSRDQAVWGPIPENGAELSGARRGDAGQYVLSARDARVRTDSRGQGGSEIYAGELLLGALASCALSAVEGVFVEQLRIAEVRRFGLLKRGNDIPCNASVA